MDDSTLKTSTPSPNVSSQNDSMMEKLAALLSGQGAVIPKSSELVLPDYVSLWKRSLAEGRKCIELYDSDSKWKKPVFSREDFARMIFADLLDRQRRKDFDNKT